MIRPAAAQAAAATSVIVVVSNDACQRVANVLAESLAGPAVAK